MPSMPQQIVKALSQLVGLPLWDSHRALNMQIFDFGARRSVKNRKGEEIEIGDYALHVQCTWRIVASDGIVVGSEDRHYSAQEESFQRDFNSDLDSSLLDSRVSRWLDEHKSNPLRVERIEPGPLAGFQLYLERGFVLEVFPATCKRDGFSELWRVFQPGRDDSHFVVCGYGIEK